MRQNLIRIFIGIMFFISASVMPAAAADHECLKINHSPVPSLEFFQRYKPVFTEAGICVELVSMPVRRGELRVVLGELDGELMRTAAWVHQFRDQVVHVPTPIHMDHIMAISLARNAYQPQSLEDLKGYDVLISGGHRWAEAKMAELGIKPAKAESYDHFVKMIQFGHVDLGIMEQTLLPLIEDKSNLKIDPLVPLPYYIALHRRHEHLIPALDASLQAFLQHGADD